MVKRRKHTPQRPETMQRNAMISSFTPRFRLAIRGPDESGA